MFAQLSVNTQQAYRPFYDGHAAGLCFAPQSPQQQPTSDCLTPNSLVNNPAVRQSLDQAMRDTMRSGEENGGWMFYDPRANLMFVNRAAEGRHVNMGRVEGMRPAMPNFVDETLDQFDQFRQNGRSVSLMAFFHTHPNSRITGQPGGSGPSGPDAQFQFDFGNRLGIIVTSAGVSFFSGGLKFDSNDRRANECITFR